MQLRRHRALQYRGSTAWPPDFGGSYGPGTTFPQGEQGTLVGVSYDEEPPPRRRTLTINFQGHASSGPLQVDDEALLPFLYRELNQFLGRPLRDIGDLDLDRRLTLLRAAIRGRLRSDAVSRTLTGTAAPLPPPWQSPPSAFQISPAYGRRCAGCDEPIVTRQHRTEYASPRGPVVFDELCERNWEEERQRI